MKKEKGFTLIELMIVIAIIAILTAITAPKFGNQIKKARDGKAIAIIGTWRNTNHMNYADTSIYSITFSELKNKVDKQTINLTYENINQDSFIGLSSTQWTQAGKSDNTNNMVSFTITGSAIESTIVFDDANGNDSKGNPWNTY